jgi:hypothetical protein
MLQRLQLFWHSGFNVSTALGQPTAMQVPRFYIRSTRLYLLDYYFSTN